MAKVIDEENDFDGIMCLFCVLLSLTLINCILDPQFGATIKNGVKIHDLTKEKWHLFCAKSPEERDQWLSGFEEERKRVIQDLKSGFNLGEYRVKLTRVGHRHSAHPEKHKGDKTSSSFAS